MLKQRDETFTLSAAAIDAISELCAQSLAEAEVDRKDILRLRLSLEEILEVWLRDMAGARVRYKAWRRLGRQHIEIAVEGAHVPPRDHDQSFMLSSRLLAQSGLVPVFAYKDGCNCLSLDPPRRLRIGSMARLIIAVVLALVLGMAVGTLPDEARGAILGVTEPLFDLFAGVLRAVASPLILLSVCCGILGMGDISAIGRVGRVTITRMVLGNFVVGALFLLVTVWSFPVGLQGGDAGTGGFSDIYRMILDIVPSDLVSPFLSGNALQIIFLGVCLGVALLALGTQVSGVGELVGQLNSLVMYFMSGIGKLLPVFIFLSLFDLMAAGVTNELSGIVKLMLILTVGCTVLLMVYVAWVCLRFRVSPAVLVKKMAPTFLLALTTASSSAALSSSMETCERKLGVPRNVAGFAVPLGQIIYMPGVVVDLLAVALCMAESYEVSITPVWLITAMVTAAMMAVASPPVPGGSAGMYTILFAQLGIPATAIALALAIFSIFDFLVTAVDVSTLQADLVLAMGSIGELDVETLRSE